MKFLDLPDAADAALVKLWGEVNRLSVSLSLWVLDNPRLELPMTGYCVQLFEEYAKDVEELEDVPAELAGIYADVFDFYGIAYAAHDGDFESAMCIANDSSIPADLLRVMRGQKYFLEKIIAKFEVEMLSLAAFNKSYTPKQSHTINRWFVTAANIFMNIDSAEEQDS